MVVLFLAAVCNLALGYGCAVALGYGDMPDIPWAEWKERLPKLPWKRKKPGQAAATAPAAESELPATAAPEPASLPAEELLYEAPAEPTGPSILESDPLELALCECWNSLQEFRRLLVAAETGIRGAAIAQRPAPAECVSGVLQTMRAQVEANQKFAERVEALANAQAGHGSLLHTIQFAVENLASQVETTSINLELAGKETGSTPSARLLSEIRKLLDVTYSCMDNVTHCRTEVRRSKNSFAQLPASAFADTLTPLANRDKLVSVLEHWWQADPKSERFLTLLAFDIDRIRDLGEAHGSLAVDQLITATGHLLSKTVRVQRKTDLPVRYSGGTFFVLLSDTGPRNGTVAAERVRQQISQTRFLHDSQELQITVTCGVTDRQSTDSPASVVERCLNTLQEAKRYGRDRTFLQEGGHPTPVVPPQYSVPAYRISLQEPLVILSPEAGDSPEPAEAPPTDPAPTASALAG